MSVQRLPDPDGGSPERRFIDHVVFSCLCWLETDDGRGGCEVAISLTGGRLSTIAIGGRPIGCLTTSALAVVEWARERDGKPVEPELMSCLVRGFTESAGSAKFRAVEGPG
jgi:hypothetical protein